MLGSDILDLRDVLKFIDDDDEDGEEARLIAQVIEDETGHTLQDVAHRYEPTLIHERYFENYAREFAEDTGAIDRNSPWPTYHIDWEAAARDLKQDYSTYEFDGHTYYGRIW